MAKFRKKKSNSSGAISTASLPDIIFMLLFFFMVTTQMKENSLFVKISVPQATEVQKMEKKSLTSFIYIGRPHQVAVYGTEPRIQLNDAFANVSDIAEFVASEREAKNEADRPFITTSLKIDQETRMGIVTDVKQELRKANALKINYSARWVEKI